MGTRIFVPIPQQSKSTKSKRRLTETGRSKTHGGANHKTTRVIRIHFTPSIVVLHFMAIHPCKQWWHQRIINKESSELLGVLRNSNVQNFTAIHPVVTEIFSQPADCSQGNSAITAETRWWAVPVPLIIQEWNHTLTLKSNLKKIGQKNLPDETD